jgi:hypothetical protein
MLNIINHLLSLTLLSQPYLISQVLPLEPPLISTQQAQANANRFLQNIEFLKVTKVSGISNVEEGQIIRNTNDTVTVESGYIILQSNDGRLTLRVETSTIFYISSNDTTNKVITLYVQHGFIRASLNQAEDNPTRVIINTPGGYAAIRGTDIGVSVSPFRVAFFMISDEANIDGEQTLPQGQSLLRYADGSELTIDLKDNYFVILEQFSVDTANRRYAIRARTENQNSVLYDGKAIAVSSEGVFILDISMEDNLPITLLTPLGTLVRLQISPRGLI